MDEIEKKVLEFFEMEASENDEPLEADTPLFDRGVIDSISFLQLVSYLEDSLGVRVRDADMKAENFKTIQAIAQYVRENR